MIKRLLNRSQDYLTALPGVEQHWINQLKGKVSCLLYHRVEAYGKHRFLDEGGSPVISEADFERELCYLKNLPSEFYTFKNLSEGQFPDHNTIGMVICFDDCFKCNYEQAQAILDRLSIPAVFFQCSGFIDSQSLNWEHLLYWLNQQPAARASLLEHLKETLNQAADNLSTIEAVRESVNSKHIEECAREVVREFNLETQNTQLANQLYPEKQMIIDACNQGHEIASHGHHHYKRETISDKRFDCDLKQSFTTLHDLLGQPAHAYSYPFNSYHTDDHERVRRHFSTIANVEHKRLHQPVDKTTLLIPRLTWPGRSSNKYRMKRWLLRGAF